MRTLYTTDNSWHIYHSKEQCEAAEAKEKELERTWINNHDPHTKLDRLKTELDRAMDIYPGTIATCSFDSLRIKGMVLACQRFVEENKEYLKHY